MLERRALNVGMRQQGRERARNIIDALAEEIEIELALDCALSADFRSSLAGVRNPYGNGTAARTIAQVLAETPLERLLIKAPAPITANQEQPSLT